MTPLLALAETVPTTLTGALVAGLSALAGAVVWLGTRLLAAKDAHAQELRAILARSGEDVAKLTEALAVVERLAESVDRNTEAVERAAAARAKR